MSVRDPSDFDYNKSAVGARTPSQVNGNTLTSAAFGHFDFQDGFMANPMFNTQNNGAFASPGLDTIAAQASGAFAVPFPGQTMQGLDSLASTNAAFNPMGSNVSVPHEWKNPAMNVMGAGMQTELMQAKALGNLYASTAAKASVESTPVKSTRKNVRGKGKNKK